MGTILAIIPLDASDVAGFTTVLERFDVIRFGGTRRSLMLLSQGYRVHFAWLATDALSPYPVRMAPKACRTHAIRIRGGFRIAFHRCHHFFAARTPITFGE